MTAKASNAGILGTGFYVPEKIVTNFDLEKMVDTSDAWIVERTGIHERRVAEDHVPMSELAFKAAEMALADAGIAAEELDLIIVATLTSDRIIPSTACILQDRLGAKHAAAFDLSAACSGFTARCISHRIPASRRNSISHRGTLGSRHGRHGLARLAC